MSSTAPSEADLSYVPPPGGWPVAPSDTCVAGRGVRTIRDVSADEVLEVAPLLIVPARQFPTINRTELAGYCFDVASDAGFALGVSSLLNHAWEPNAVYDADPERLVLTVTALVDIPAGAEVTINYNGEPGNRSPLWFDPEEQSDR